MKNTWIILGASSAIARAFCRELAERGDSLILAGRKKDDLKATATDCTARGAPDAQIVLFDARDPASFDGILKLTDGIEGNINAAVFVGSMPSQDAINDDPSLVDGTIIDSFTGPARFLQMLAPVLEQRGGGTIVGVGSVAGDRGRLDNYVYGSAKAGFATYLQGLRNRLGRSGAHVLTVKPGPVDTPMTAGMDGLPFMSTPDAVAADIIKGVDKKRNVIYTAKIWWLIMLVIKSIPEAIFKKLSI